MSTVVIDTNLCVGCRDCTQICPVAVYTAVPAPCQTACPLNTDITGVLSLIKQERFDDALDLLREVNAMPGVTGRVCPHPCESDCRRGELDEALAIQLLERAAAAHGSSQGRRAPVRGEKVAIVGSGPAGLSAAYHLARRGYPVTIFEALAVAGGMLAAGIPEYRLSRDIVEGEITRIKDLGVDIRLNTSIKGTGELLKQGYQAILLATGAHQSQKLDIPGEGEFDGVEDALSFLQRINLGKKSAVSGRAIVVGGGNAAIDAARVLLRLGAREVNVVYRRSRQEMPAIESEVAAAEREGVKIHYLVAPSRVLGKNGAVTGLECVRTELGKPDASGRRRPLPVRGSEFVMSTDLIVSAIGEKPDLSSWGSKLAGAEGFAAVDPSTMATRVTGVFAAGDVATGPGTVVAALAAGRRAADSIDSYLRGSSMEVATKQVSGDDEKTSWWKNIRPAKRRIPKRVAKDKLDFKQIERGLTRSQAIKEAQRCLGCAIFAHLDTKSCCGDSCRTCEYHCWKGAISVLGA